MAITPSAIQQLRGQGVSVLFLSGVRCEIGKVLFLIPNSTDLHLDVVVCPVREGYPLVECATCKKHLDGLGAPWRARKLCWTCAQEEI